MSTHDIEVTRDGKWWMVAVPGLDALTQARRLGEVEQMARELIALSEDVPVAAVTLGEVHIYVGEQDYASVRSEVARLKARAVAAEDEVSRLMRKTAHDLAASSVPTRDIGTVLGVSHQRVAQLVG